MDQIIYNRLCTGHTRLTHSYLIEHTDPPKCTNCNQLLSVKHILTECTSYGQTRQQYYFFTDITNVFNHSPSQNVLNFILKSHFMWSVIICKLGGCLVLNAQNTVFCSKHSAIYAQAVSCIRRGLVSRDSIVCGDWLPVTEWSHRYLPCCQSALDVAEDVGRFLVFLYGVYRLREWYWIDSNGRNGN